MKLFLGVVSKGRHIDGNIENRIHSLVHKIYKINQSTHKTEGWISESKRVGIFSWTNEGNEAAVYRNVWSSNNNAVTMSGYFNDDHNLVVNNLLKKIPSIEDTRDYVSTIGGLYSLCIANGQKETLTLWNTITRVEPIYWCENEEYYFVSTRALLIHLLAKEAEKPTYQLENLVSFLNMGFMNNESTPFQHVHVLKPSTELTVSSVGFKERSIPTNRITNLTGSTSEIYDELASKLIQSFEPLKRHNVKITSGLTGGKDSRLIIAALHHIGIDFSTFTSGFSDHPDVVVAQKIAQALNIEHTVSEPQVKKSAAGEYLEFDILKRTRNVLNYTDGMMTGYENISGNTSFNWEKVQLGGHGGELVRGGYAKILRKNDQAHMERFIKNMFMKFSHMIREEPFAQYQNGINDWVNLQKEKHSPAEVLDLYYLHYRTGRWSAAGRSANSTGFYLYQPFFDGPFVDQLYQLPSDIRINEEVMYNLVLRLAPKLVDIPFFNDRWKFEKDGPAAGQEEIWQKRAPVTGEKNKRGSFNWRETVLTDMKDAFYEEILHNHKSEQLFDIVDKGKVKEIFESPKYLNDKSINRFLWNLYTSSVLVSNKWLEISDESHGVTIRIPDKNDNDNEDNLKQVITSNEQTAKTVRVLKRKAKDLVLYFQNILIRLKRW